MTHGFEFERWIGELIATHTGRAVESALCEHTDSNTTRNHTENFRLGWVSNAQAQKMLGLSRSTLQRFRNSGNLPYSKVGANIWYRAQDIDDLLTRNLRGRAIVEVAE